MRYRFKICCCCNHTASVRKRKCARCGGNIFRQPTHEEIVAAAEKRSRMVQLLNSLTEEKK